MTMMADRTDSASGPDLPVERFEGIGEAQAAAAAVLASLLAMGLPTVAWSLYDINARLDGSIMRKEQMESATAAAQAEMACLDVWAERFDVPIVNPYETYDRPHALTYRQIEFVFGETRVKIFVALPSPEVAAEIGR